MAFKHARDSPDVRKAGRWEICGRIILKTRSGRAVLFHDGVGKKFLPLRAVSIQENGDGTVTVCMPDWLHKEPYEKEEKARDITG